MRVEGEAGAREYTWTVHSSMTVSPIETNHSHLYQENMQKDWKEICKPVLLLLVNRANSSGSSSLILLSTEVTYI